MSVTLRLVCSDPAGSRPRRYCRAPVADRPSGGGQRHSRMQAQHYRVCDHVETGISLDDRLVRNENGRNAAVLQFVPAKEDETGLIERLVSTGVVRLAVLDSCPAMRSE